jgi:uncharacterized membrane protein
MGSRLTLTKIGLMLSRIVQSLAMRLILIAHGDRSFSLARLRYLSDFQSEVIAARGMI